MKNTFLIIFGFFITAWCITSCKKDDESPLKNQFIKRTNQPMIVGDSIYFAYGAGSLNGGLSTMQVVASIPGAQGTGFESITHRMTPAGTEETKVVATSVETHDVTSTANLIDTNATTLRYYYVIPEAARGKQISFAFSVTNKAGNKASTSTPYYTISKMDIKRNDMMIATTTDKRYFSIADMKAYTFDEVEAGNLSAKIDFIYSYAATISPSGTAYAYKHTFVSPATNSIYFPAGFTIPDKWTKNSTAMERKIGTMVYDGQLKMDPSITIFIDDMDLINQSFTNSANYVINMTKDGGIFMKTADGKYTAFIYINNVEDANMKVIFSMKRYQNN